MSVVDIRPPKTSTEYCGGAGAATTLGTATVGGGSRATRPGRSAAWPGIAASAHASAPRHHNTRSTPPSMATRVLDYAQLICVGWYRRYRRECNPRFAAFFQLWPVGHYPGRQVLKATSSI